jgi:hypothetical protein
LSWANENRPGIILISTPAHFVQPDLHRQYTKSMQASASFPPIGKSGKLNFEIPKNILLVQERPASCQTRIKAQFKLVMNLSI